MKIALIGYGKMGKEIERIARSRGHEIVSIIDLDNQQDFASEAFRSADVAIEFTNPQARTSPSNLPTRKPPTATTCVPSRRASRWCPAAPAG